MKEVNTEIEFSQVILNTEATAGEKLMLLQGWAPASKEKEIAAWLDEQHIYYEITNPTPEDNVPIQLTIRDSLPGLSRYANSTCFRNTVSWI